MESLSAQPLSVRSVDFFSRSSVLRGVLLDDSSGIGFELVSAASRSLHWRDPTRKRGHALLRRRSDPPRSFSSARPRCFLSSVTCCRFWATQGTRQRYGPH
jgi:hypothetical protein